MIETMTTSRTLTRSTTDPQTSGQAKVPQHTGPKLPPAGPAWYSTVMGTGILSTLLGLHSDDVPSLRVAASALLVLGSALLAGLSGAFIARGLRDRTAFTSTLSDSAVLPLWGTVSMGLLAIGSATLSVVPTVVPDLAHTAVLVDATLWVVGTVIGATTALGFVAVLVRREVGHPTPVWGLPIVPPMVSATTGAALVPHLASTLGRCTLLVVAVGCFFLALLLGSLVFAIAYHHYWRVAPLPIGASTAAWIPLGIVGQSTAAAQAIAAQTDTFLLPPALPAVHALANAFGYAMLLASVPVIIYAVRVTVRGFRARMPFTPGWWALTFPLGTLALGAHLLGQSTGQSLIEWISRAAIVALVGTWSLCSIGTLAALQSDRRRGTAGQ